MTAHFKHDPGGKVRLKLPVGMTGWATFSDCGRYRRALGRHWTDLLSVKLGFPLWLGMNPSTADGNDNDPTVGREIDFTKSWGYSRYVKCNIGDFRATDPKHLGLNDVPACTPENVIEIFQRAQEADFVILAHGVVPKCLRADCRGIVLGLVEMGIPLFCLGTTKDGWPRHPLYLKKDSLLQPFDGREILALAS